MTGSAIDSGTLRTARPSRRAARLQRRRVARRKWMVAASAVITVALGLGYAVADAYDIAPGPLSVEPVQTIRFPQAASAVAATPLVGGVGADKGVDEARATALVDKFAKAKGVGKDFSIIIADAKGDPVVERNQGVAREPASTMKTLTAFAATASLDMSSTLDTETYLDGDTLVLKGNGDMLLGSGANDERHVNGRAGVATLAQRTAQALKAKGVTTVSVAYDDSLFGSKRFPDTIAENNEGDDMLYAAPMSSMAIDEGRNWSGTTKPADPDVESAFPPRFADSAAKTAESFVAQLKRQGIAVNGGIAKGEAPAGKPIASVSSARLSEVMGFMLRNSDNTEAELFGRLTALKTGQDNSPEGAAAAVKAALEKAGIDTAGLHIADCSGLSVGSRLTATTLMQVQAKYLETGDSTAPASEGLAVSGLSGTAAKRNIARSAAGLVRLKTGTLGGVTSMTGNVSRTAGGTLVFAVIVNNPDNMWEAILAVDDLVGHLPEL